MGICRSTWAADWAPISASCATVKMLKPGLTWVCAWAGAIPKLQIATASQAIRVTHSRLIGHLHALRSGGGHEWCQAAQPWQPGENGGGARVSGGARRPAGVRLGPVRETFL